MREQRCSRARGDLVGVRGDGSGRIVAPARAPRGVPCLRDALDRAELHGRGEHRPRHPPERHVRDHVAAGGTRRVPLPERRPRHRRDGSGRRARIGSVDVRVGREQGGHLRQRPPELLGRGSRDGCRADVPRVLREPAAVRQAGPAHRQAQADRRREERSEHGRESRGDVAHGGAARRFGLHRGCALPPERRDPHRYPRATVRRGDAPCGPTGAGREPRRHRHERGWLGDPVRRYVRIARPRRSGAERGHGRGAAFVPSRGLIRVEPRRHDRLGRRRGLRAHDPGGVRQIRASTH